MSAPPSEKGVAFHSEHAVPTELHLHQEVLSEVPADRLAAEVLLVDDAKREELRRELATNSQGGYFPLTPEEKVAHRRLNRKFDLFIIPFCACIYLFNGLDRSNLGNAQTDNFSANLGLSATSVNTATSLFFATYVPLQPLMAGIGKRVGQIRFIAVISTLWGILTICHAFVKNDAQLIAVRLLMGVAESGFYPSVLSYLSLFYPRYDLAFRFSLFYAFFAIAGAFGGLIAFGVFQIQGKLYAWQYLFFIEGSVPIILGVIAPFYLPRNTQAAWFLTPAEKAYSDNRMVIDSAANYGATYKLSRRDIIEAFKDWKIWLTLSANILVSTAPQGFTVFFPVVVKGLGYSGATANLMTVPPYVAGAVVLLCFARSSDHFHERSFHILGGLTIVIIGFAITIALPLANQGGRYAGLVILLAGTFIASPLTSAWLSGNTPEPGKRTIILAINGWGNLAGIIGSELFLSQYGPAYHYPLTATLGMIIAGWVMYAVLHVTYRLVNRAKAKRLANMTAAELEQENLSDVRYADKKFTFVYGL